MYNEFKVSPTICSTHSFGHSIVMPVLFPDNYIIYEASMIGPRMHPECSASCWKMEAVIGNVLYLFRISHSWCTGTNNGNMVFIFERELECHELIIDTFEHSCEHLDELRPNHLSDTCLTTFLFLLSTPGEGIVCTLFSYQVFLS